MPCPCLVVTLVVSPLATLLGFETPKTWKGKVVSVILTSTTTALTVLALKIFFNFSICGATGTLPLKILRATLITIPITLAYSLAYGVALARLEKRTSQVPSPAIEVTCSNCPNCPEQTAGMT
jgi:hypothetical protein